MRYLMEHAVVPYLERRMGQRQVMVTQVLRTVGVGESRVDQAIADLETSTNPTVGLSAHPGQTDVRIVAKAATAAEAEALVAGFEETIRQRLGAAIYATGNLTLEAVVADLLEERDATLAVAETITHGDITRRFAAHPNVFRGGVVAAEGDGFARLLGAEQSTVAGEEGAVALADGVRRALEASYGIGVLGVESGGPWVAIAGPDGVDTRQQRFTGRDARVRTWTTTLALEFLRRLLLDLADGWSR
jgi:nicotinamide mononucleotide (NMN) deamidase PncC